MIRLLVDQNFNGHILVGMANQESCLDFIHVRDVELSEALDPKILEWAAIQGRVLLTHDRRTIPAFAYARIKAGLPMPGVFLVNNEMQTGQAIEEILIAVLCMSPEECKDIVKYFPM